MSKAPRRLISSLEVAGGFFGLLFLAKQLPGLRLDIYVILLAPIAISIFLLSFIAGVLLWRDHRAGRMASIIVQTIQLPKVVSPLLTFLFSFGLDFYPYIQINEGRVLHTGVDFKISSFYNLYLNRIGTPFAVGISIPAIFLLIVLLRHKPGSTRAKPVPPPPPTDSEWTDSGDAAGAGGRRQEQEAGKPI